jgi:hypothetical protein
LIFYLFFNWIKLFPFTTVCSFLKSKQVLFVYCRRYHYSFCLAKDGRSCEGYYTLFLLNFILLNIIYYCFLCSICQINLNMVYVLLWIFSSGQFYLPQILGFEFIFSCSGPVIWLMRREGGIVWLFEGLGFERKR